MSQPLVIVTRKKGEEKDKRQTDSPVKEMKKKIAANAEKEKLAAEKHPGKSTDKQPEKATEKHADKHADKKDKSAEKHVEKTSERKEKGVDKSVEKTAEKKDKTAEKTIEKVTDKKDKSTEKSADKKDKSDKKEEKPKDEDGSAEKSGKTDREEEKPRKADTTKQNGDASASKAQNGAEPTNGTVSESDDEELIIVEQENDEMFPELTYDDNSDADGFEPDAASRSLTRRSQVKVTRTPETPRPASEKQADKDTDDSKEPKLLKLKEDVTITDRKLRSANSPKPQDKKEKEEKKSQENESPKKQSSTVKKSDKEPPKKQVVEEASDREGNSRENNETSERVEMEVVIEVESSEEPGEGEARRRDTKFSRSRVKVSPYRRSARLADTTVSSALADYTGNNTTMEMDITESSILSEEPSSLDDSYLSGLRSIRGRRSYKPLKLMALRNISVNTSLRSSASLTGADAPPRPTGTVVGRKRRPERAGLPGAARGDGDAEGAEAEQPEGEAPKRARLLERLARPFRTHSTPLPARRAAEIVGINTDLPLTAPVATADTFDPESIKPTPSPAATSTPTPTSASTHGAPERDSKRCIVM